MCPTMSAPCGKSLEVIKEERGPALSVSPGKLLHLKTVLDMPISHRINVGLSQERQS